jgi:hypothetical protein
MLDGGRRHAGGLVHLLGSLPGFTAIALAVFTRSEVFSAPK